MLAHELDGQAVTSEQARHTLRVGAPPAALCRHAKCRNDLARRLNSRLVSSPVVVVNQPEQQGGFGIQTQLRQGTKISVVRAIFRHR